jgi:hypothetical protein
MNLVLGLLIALQTTDPQSEPKGQLVEPAKSLEAFDPAALKKRGWEEVSMPSDLPKTIKGIIVENGSLPGVGLKESVTVKVRWVITDSVRVPPDTEQQVMHKLTDDERRRSFKVMVAGVGYEWSISKEKARRVLKGNLEIDGTVKTLPNEEALQMGLQQSVEVYDSGGKLIGKGYLWEFSFATFKRVIICS